MYRSFLSTAALTLAVIAALPRQASAQQHVHQVVVLSEGYYDFTTGEQVVPVTLGSYDPATGTHATVATIPGARFGNDVKVEDGIVYVSADSFLLKYDANTFELLGQESVFGIRRIALWNDHILLTRAEFSGVPNYFEARDKNTLALLYTIAPTDGIPYTCEAVEVLGDKAYITMNNGFSWPDYTNLVAVVDLVTESVTGTIDLGPDGYNPEHLMASGGALYAFNNKDYTGSSISRIDVVSDALVGTTNVALTSGCGTSTAAADRIYYMEYAVDQLARYDLTTGQVLDTLNNGLSAYGIIGDPINNVLYVTTTDFVSSGTLYVTENDGVILGSTPVGVAVGKMALDIRLSTGGTDHGRSAFGVFPNPAVDQLTLSGRLPEGAVAVRIMDAMGRLVASEVRNLVPGGTIDVGGLRAGLYTLQIGEAIPVRFTKQ